MISMSIRPGDQVTGKRPGSINVRHPELQSLISKTVIRSGLRRRHSRQIIDPQGFLEVRHARDHCLEPILTKLPTLVSFKIFSIASNSFGDTTLLNFGKRSVSSLASCGLYIVMNDCIPLTSLT